MRQKTLWLAYMLLCSASALHAEASQTSEDRQKDTFTLYDRNAREVNWQRQHKEYQHPSNAPNQPRISRDRYNRYERAPQDYNMRWSDENVPMSQPRGQSYSTNRQHTFSRRANEPVRASYQANAPVYYDDSYAQPNVRRYYSQNNENYNQDDFDSVRTSPRYSQIPAVPPIE